jgi:hypothetical protein
MYYREIPVDIDLILITTADPVSPAKSHRLRAHGK